MNSKDTSPLVSAIIPTRDRPEMLIRAAKSVVRQTYRNIEIIIVDDGSASGIEGRIREETELRSCRVIENTRRPGAAGARNTGFYESRGEFVGFLDDDDEWLPAKIEKQIHAFRKSDGKVGIVCTQFSFILNSTKIISRDQLEGDMYETVRRKVIVGNSSVPLIKRHVLDEVGLFDEDMPAAQDTELWLRIAKRYHFTTVNEPLALIHWHGSERITTNHRKQILGAYKLLRKHWTDLPAGRRYNLVKTIIRLSLAMLRGEFHETRH